MLNPPLLLSNEIAAFLYKLPHGFVLRRTRKIKETNNESLREKKEGCYSKGKGASLNFLYLPVSFPI